MRLAVLTDIPEIAGMLSRKAVNLGHTVCGVIATRRPEPGRAHPGGPAGVSAAALTGRAADLDRSIAGLEPDLLVSWTFSLRVPEATLAAVRHGGINLHPSLLPRHRGPNPLGWAIRCGDGEYGVTWHRMVGAVDAGPILGQRAVPLAIDDTLEEVNLRISTLGIRMLEPALSRLLDGDGGEDQDERLATSAPPFGPDFVHIDFRRSAGEVHDQIRAWSLAAGSGRLVGPTATLGGRTLLVERSSITPVPGALKVECRDAPLWLTRVSPVPRAGQTDSGTVRSAQERQPNSASTAERSTFPEVLSGSVRVVEI